MGYGAVKYADLRQNRIKDYVFNYDNMLSLEGNTAVYLLFAYARVRSILDKSGEDVESAKGSAQVVCLDHPSELELALELLKFKDMVRGICSC